MKIKSFVSVIVLSTLVFFGACKKDESSSSGSTKTNEIRTQIDGTTWSGPILSWAVSGGTRQLNANAATSSMQIFMPADTTGTFNAMDNIVTVSYNDGTATWSNNVSGIVNITTNTDDLVEGTFEVVVASYFNSDTLTFTSGNFYFKGL